MKRLFTIVAFVALALNVFAQSPEKISYQAVIRDGNNDLVVSQGVGIQVSILQGGNNGTSVYTETQNVSTNVNGLVTFEIGNGISGDNFSAINWANGPYYIKTETDPTTAGGTSYTITGVSQLLSVPYALHAKTADNVDDADADPANEIQTLSKTGNTVTLSNGGGSFTDSVGVYTSGTGISISGNVISATGSGATSSDSYGTGQLIVLASTTTYTLIPGLTASINLPNNATVIITTSGGLQCSVAGTAFAAADIGIHVDGAPSPQAGQQRIIASNTQSVGQMITYWSMTKTYTLTSGVHTIDVRARDAAGTADANVSGTSPLIQGVLTVTILGN